MAKKTLLSLVTAFALSTGAVVARGQSPSAQGTQPGAVSHRRMTFSPDRLLSKTAEPSADTQVRGTSGAIIEIRVEGLEPLDFVNIRPAGSRVAVVAGTLSKRAGETSSNNLSVLDKLALGNPPPASALEVTNTSVAFGRSKVLAGTIFLDVEVPRESVVRFVSDGKLIFRAKLSQPLAYRSHELATGSPNMTGSLARAALSAPGSNNESWGPLYDSSDGSYVIPSSRLTVLKQTRFELNFNEPLAVVLKIDETGHVMQVTAMTDRPTPGLEESMRQWQFAPFVVGDRAVQVKAIMKLPSR